jgi:ketosteroid isomerase-like protein
MSQQGSEIVRKPLRAHQRSSRTLDERLSLRFPRLADRCLRLILGLPPSSRLRQAALWRSARLLVEALNRRDLDAMLISYHPDFEYDPPREIVEAGLAEPCYRGRAGFRKAVSDWSDVWGADAHLEPIELIDLGDRGVLVSELAGRAQASGVALTQQWASAVTLKDGKVIRQQEFLDHAQALEAAGLRA